MPISEFLRSLLTAVGPSGHESRAAAAWRSGCEAWADEVGCDLVGSSWARVRGTGDGPRLIIVGHIDEIGVHITHIDDKGFLHFGQVGGWDALVLVGQRVRLLTRDGEVSGVIARKPIHLLEDEDRKKAPEIKHLHIDLGVDGSEEAAALVRVGDVGVIDVDPLELRNDLVVSRALDNRVGCYVAAEAARLVAESGGAPGEVVAVAAAQEEISFAGSRTSAYALEPDVAIAVDVTFETGQPGIELGQITRHAFGSGPVVARGLTLSPAVAELLFEAAEAEGIGYTSESLGRGTGTDADAIHISRSGVPTGLMSVPLRYMHSPVEMVSLADIDAAARLIAAFARRLTAETSFAR